MSVTDEQLKAAVDAARARESQGYFAKAKAGDQRAASLFVRLVAFDLNPSGSSSGFGWLTKQPGESQVDGYAEDAIVYGASPSDLQNVIDLVNGAGAPNASIGGAVKERRPANLWAAPHALSAEEMAYLAPVAPPTPIQPPGREEARDELRWLDQYYVAPEGLKRPNGLSLNGKPDFEGIAAWYLDVYQRERMAKKTRAEARAAVVSAIRHTDEWQQKHPGETP